MRARGRPAAALLVALAAALLGVSGGCASRMGGQATQGAIEALRATPPPGEQRLAERVGGDTTRGALEELTTPEGMERFSAVVDAAVTRSFEAALRSPRASGGEVRVHGRRGGTPPRSLVERAAWESADSFGTAFSLALARALGPDGQGPLAQSLGATAEQVSSSAVRGARSELAGLFPACGAMDQATCLEAGARSLGRAAAQGFVEGLFGSAALPALALAFLLGILVPLVLRGTLRIFRRPRPLEHREAHP